MGDTLLGVAGVAGGTAGALWAVGGLLSARGDVRDDTLLGVLGWLGAVGWIVLAVCAVIGGWRWLT